MHSVLSYVRSLLGWEDDIVVKPNFKRDRLGDDYSSDEEPVSKRFKELKRTVFPRIMTPKDDWENTRLQASKVRYVPIQVESGHASTSTPTNRTSQKYRFNTPEVSYIEPKVLESNKKNKRTPRIFIECIDDSDDDDIVSPTTNNNNVIESDEQDDVMFVNEERLPKGKFYFTRDPDLYERIETTLGHKTGRSIVSEKIQRPIQKTNAGITKMYKSQLNMPKWLNTGKDHTRPPLKRINPVSNNARTAIAEAFNLEEKKSYQELIRRATLAIAPKNSPPPVTIVDLLDEDDDPKPSNSSLRLNLDTRYGTSIRSRLERDIRTEDSLRKTTEYDPITVASLASSPDFEEVPVVSPSSTSSSNSIRVEAVNSLRDSMKGSIVLEDDWLSKVTEKYREKRRRAREKVTTAQAEADTIERLNHEAHVSLLERKLRTELSIPESVEIIEEEPVVPELNESQIKLVEKALGPGPPNQLLVEKFNLRIHRRDLQTLAGLNWLNDEVINFYMNLLMQRCSARKNLPKVYATNTFFYPKLMQSGQAGLKRWTKKIDIFAHNIMAIPVHLGVHWCMCIVDFDNKKVSYMDSMGGRNPQACNAVLQYLRDEHMDKRSTPLEVDQWSAECLKDIPQQMNGSDCGVFSCTFAEFASRRAPYKFSQENMPLLRKKMAFEILRGELLT